ncbi:Protein arginine N-methyltransferase 3 [Liparis tanakae]|uniref:type I protein arginine methyltransferase n=1 Tax=Liparis tanakae TaxID=230148 RepID=A0A4Z2H089_9TELE|nr:Protein arginine N-methyltransferase 3 [Liparis tanakae]
MAEYIDPRGDAPVEEMPELSDDDWDDNDNDEDLWQAADEEDSRPATVTCLFCDRLLSSVPATLQHCADDHQFNLVEVIQRHHLDDYGFIKMINFIRSTKCDASGLTGLPDAPLPWESEDFLLPVLQDDPLLQIDPEELCEDASLPVCSSSGAQSHDALQQRAQAAEERASTSEQALTRAMDDLHKLKLLAQGLVLNGETSRPANQSAVADLREDEDEAYFSSYGHYSIHEEMLKV